LSECSREAEPTTVEHSGLGTGHSAGLSTTLRQQALPVRRFRRDPTQELKQCPSKPVRLTGWPLDQWELVGGDRVTGRVEDAIRATATGVLVVSPHALSRPWVREEYQALLRQAVENPAERRLIPVLYHDAELPVFVANRLWVDFREAASGPAYEGKLRELERYLRGETAADRP
jgi:hypothetical protein